MNNNAKAQVVQKGRHTKRHGHTGGAGGASVRTHASQTVTLPGGEPNPAMYFWATGMLSAFLDNAPTYLVFFNTAGGDADVLMTARASTLAAISAGVLT